MKNTSIAAAILLLTLLALMFSLTGCSEETTAPAATSITATNPTTTTFSQVTQSSVAAQTSQTSISATQTVTSELTASATPSTRIITDMYGRTLTVPTKIERVLTSGPIEMELVYLIAPEKLVGLSFSFNGQPPLVSEKYSSLPVIGGWFGTQTGNYETFIAANPDIILEGTEANIAERQDKFGSIPVVGLSAGDESTNYNDDALTGYEAEIRYLGELLDAQDRAESLIAYYQEAMDYVTGIVSLIPENERVKVYYAEGKEGFNTDPVGSMHTRLLEFCGGVNVADVDLKPGYGMAETSMEQILLWDPDMIIIGRGSQTNLFTTVMTNETWKQVTAVQNLKVEIRPDNPFSWFDGPPGPCQIVGMYWMVNKLYPEQTDGLDMQSKVKEFYTQYLHYELTDTELSGLLSRPTLP